MGIRTVFVFNLLVYRRPNLLGPTSAGTQESIFSYQICLNSPSNLQLPNLPEQSFNL